MCGFFTSSDFEKALFLYKIVHFISENKGFLPGHRREREAGNGDTSPSQKTKQ
jgi:hypothetical protein